MRVGSLLDLQGAGGSPRRTLSTLRSVRGSPRCLQGPHGEQLPPVRPDPPPSPPPRAHTPAGALNDLYAFDPAGQRWARLAASGGPSARFLPGIAAAPSSGLLFVFGGDLDPRSLQSGTISINPAQPQNDLYAVRLPSPRELTMPRIYQRLPERRHRPACSRQSMFK